MTPSYAKKMNEEQGLLGSMEVKRKGVETKTLG
jgi:hypothetical protein